MSPVCVYNEAKDEYSVSIRLSPGTYIYKFIVDGYWVIADEYPKLKDAKGILNNVVTVV